MDTVSRCTVVVVGMHRSGTSVLTNALSLIGGSLPVRLMKAHESNPVGHFEPETIVALHDRMLAAAGSSWSDWRRFPADWFHSAECEQFKQELMVAFHEDFGDSPIALIKDPRLCRILPVWQSIFNELKFNTFYVLPYRNPVEVVRSLVDRNNLDPYWGYLLWLRHLVEAEHTTRGLPRVFVPYEAFLAEPRQILESLIAASPFPWPQHLDQALPEGSAAVQRNLRHHHATVDALSDRMLVPAWVHQTYECYQSLERNASGEAMLKLDAIRASFDILADAFGEDTVKIEFDSDREGHQQFVGGDELRLHNFRLQEIRASLVSEPSFLNVLPVEAEPDPESVSRLNHELRERSARLGYLYAVLGRSMSVLGETNKQFAEHMRKSEQARATLEEQIDNLRTELETALRSLSSARVELEVVRKSLQSYSGE